MYSFIYKYFQGAATLTARLFHFLQVYLFSDHSVYYSSLRVISAGFVSAVLGEDLREEWEDGHFQGHCSLGHPYTDCDLHL